jgi:putative zinc finger protein
MDWNCTFTEERLSDYLDGQMTPEESAAFSTHATSCANCARLMKQVGGLVREMQRLEPVREPAQLVLKILAATTGARPEKQGWKRMFEWVPVLWQPRFAMGAVTVAASLVIVFHFVGVTPGKLKRTDLSPAGLVHSANRQVHLAYARSAKFVNDLRVVYEIQSALQRPPEPQVTPASEPEPKSDSPSSNPDQKSQTEPRPRSQVHNSVMLAFLSTDPFTSFTRSAR